MIGGVQPQSSERLGGPARGGPWAARCSGPAHWSADGWARRPRPRGRRARRTSGSQLSCSSSRGRRRRSTTPRWAARLCTQRPRTPVAAASSRRTRSARLRCAGWRRSRTCGDECGSRLCGVVAVENDDAVGATADLAKRKRDAALGLCGEPLLDTRGNDAMSPSGAAASLLAASASMSSDPSRLRSRPGRAATKTALPRPG
jgi:hypothetical protein